MILQIRTLGSACLVVALTCCTASRESTGQPPPAKESTDSSAHPHTNRLINETSPYLLQHAHNPVDWYPWGPAAFAKAQAENKPIFLSVGYSTCYWCHVMERESFEQEDVAKILNEHFIAIKVDREERPEIDQQYMLATQLIVGRGGWPNSLWLTPDGRPWMAGTYFPRAQFKSALLQLADAWKTRGPEVLQQATSLTETIERIGVAKFESKPLSQDLIDATVTAAIDRFDAQHGGFSVAPKFPPHAQLTLLIDQFRRHGDGRLLSMVDTTLEHMSRGGVFDQLGGGFHRYSTDQQWLLPHFEKMLYDNGQLLKSYTDGFLLTGNAEHRETVARVFQWLQRDMTSPAGGFYSAIDSESNAQEGKYYVWRYDELLSVLGKAEGERFAEVYGARTEGNFEEESTGHGTGDNVLHLQASIADIARAGGSGVAEFEEQLSLQRAQLLQFRSARAAPTRDDKIIAAWNGLMIEGLAYAGRLLENDDYVEAARRAADFILEKMIVDGQLHRTYRAGEVKFTGTLDDHAFVAAGLIELYRATDDQRYLLAASELAQRVLTEFDDADGGGFYFTALNSADTTAGLVIRAKNLNGGGNLPSGNGVITQVLFDLAELTSDSKYSAAARRNLQGLSGYLWRSTAAADALHIATATFLDRESALASPANISDAKFSAKAIAGQVFLSHQELVAGQKFTLAVQCDIDPAWHLYGPNPGTEFVQPTTLKFTDSNTFKVVDIQSPTGTIVRDTVLEQDLRVYTGQVIFRVELQVASDAPVGPAELKFAITSQACDARQCAQPEQTQVGLAVTILAGGQTPRPQRHVEIFGE